MYLFFFLRHHHPTYNSNLMGYFACKARILQRCNVILDFQNSSHDNYLCAYGYFASFVRLDRGRPSKFEL